MQLGRCLLAAALAVVAVAIAGCSDDALTPGVQTTESAGWQPPSPTPRLLPDDVAALREHCLDRRGFVDGATPTGEGPHPIVIFDLDIRGVGGIGSLAKSSLPAEWLAERPADAVLVGCFRSSDGDTPLGECRYSAQITGLAPNESIPLYSRDYQVSIYDLHFPARQVARFAVEATEGGCPDRIQHVRGSPPERVTPELTGSELRSAIEDVVIGPR